MSQDGNGLCPLCLSAKMGDIGTVRAILGAEGDADGRTGTPTPLFFAASKGHVEIVQTLLDAGADADGRGGKRSPLFIASKRGFVEIVQALLAAGADTEIPQKLTGLTPLHVAASFGRIGCVQALLHAGADVGARDAKGMTPLIYAHLNVRALLGGEPRILGWTTEGCMKADGRRNIMLYWDDMPPPEVSVVVKKWSNVCPTWNVVLFDERKALGFLYARFGREIARLFLRCAIPAMRADFFRVFWTMSEGGIYTDVKFVPKKEPLFFNPEKDISVIKSINGEIQNNFFYSKKDSKELNFVALEIIRSISVGIPYVNHATGPAVWARVLGEKETSTMAIIKAKSISEYIDRSGYSREKRPERDWSKQQEHGNIYREIAVSQGSP